MENSTQTRLPITLFNLGFRIFFLSAGFFSILAIGLWTAVYQLDFTLPMTGITLFQWHAHEMIYGYALAAIAGFLLTAVRNWTGVQTLHGPPLALLFSCWAIARLLLLAGTQALLIAAAFDLLFMLGLIAAISYPIFKVKQWKQLAIVSKIVLLGVFNLIFYLGALGVLDLGAHWGVYAGLFLVISLIMTLGRRVVPFFIEKGVNERVQLKNSKILDIASLVFFLLFSVIEVFFELPNVSAACALMLFLINARRLLGWYTPGIWQKPLLWSLYLGFWFICVGFLLSAIGNILGSSQFPAVHAFALGGVGIMTLGMMSRVSLGHSGRSIAAAPRSMPYAFAILIMATTVRVFLPMLFPSLYTLWVGLAQVLWIMAFGLFSITYLPILSQPRADGQPG